MPVVQPAALVTQKAALTPMAQAHPAAALVTPKARQGSIASVLQVAKAPPVASPPPPVQEFDPPVPDPTQSVPKASASPVASPPPPVQEFDPPIPDQTQPAPKAAPLVPSLPPPVQEFDPPVPDPTQPAPKTDLPAAEAPVPVSAGTGRAKRHHSAFAAMLHHDDDDTPAASPKPAAPKARKAKPTAAPSFLDGVYSAARGNLPTAYGAWTPSDSSKTADDAKKQAMAAMGAGFGDDDDDSAPAPKPKPKPPPHHFSLVQEAPSRQARAGSEEAEYDNDDLPTHHSSPMQTLEGVDAIVKAKARDGNVAHTKDATVALMDNLFTPPPTSYAAWTPSANPPAASNPDSNAAAFQKAAKDFDLDSFLQVSSRRKILAPSSDAVADLILKAAAPAAAASGQAELLIQEGRSVEDSAGMRVATTLLEQYALVLQSPPLHQLARAHVPLPKMSELAAKMREVDPIGHPRILGHTKEFAALQQQCRDGEGGDRTAAALRSLEATARKTGDELESVRAHGAAVAAEMDASAQLRRLFGQDVHTLTSLLREVNQTASAPGVLAAQQRMMSQPGAVTLLEAEAIDAAAGRVRDARAELQDAVGVVLQKRSEAEDEQGALYGKLSEEKERLQPELARRSAAAARAEAALEEARRNRAAAETRCYMAALQFDRRQHRGHLEVQAIQAVLDVLGPVVNQ